MLTNVVVYARIKELLTQALCYAHYALPLSMYSMSMRTGNRVGCDRGKVGVSVQQRVKIVGSTQAACANRSLITHAASIMGHH